ncbi:MAG TPA: hypothetical protein PKA74_18155, partial [Bauldia sp.]|nr:hypothetical protein [Bauldia sp.]
MPVGPLLLSVGTEAELRAAIFQVSNAAAGGSAIDAIITLTANIDLSQSLPMIRGDLAHTITINGDGYTIDAKETGRVFFVESGKVEIGDVTIANASAKGGDGGDGASFGAGAGGGLGAGAAEVTISGVQIADASATGGDGGVVIDDYGFSGGGGGLGGDGGNGGLYGSGGGGGYEGDGGSAIGASAGGG